MAGRYTEETSAWLSAPIAKKSVFTGLSYFKTSDRH